MKKIIITREQLNEAITQIQTGLTTQQQLINAARNANDNQRKGYDNTVVDNPNGNGDTVNLEVPKDGIPKQKDLTAAGKASKIVVSQEKQTNNALNTGAIVESSYSKKQIEEVRGISKVMTKRALEESWGRWDTNLDNFFEEFQQRKYHYEMMYNDFIRGCEIIEQQLKLAVEMVKEELQDMGLQMTNMNVRYDDEEVEITMNTNWILKGGDFDEDEVDYRRYKYLSNIGDGRTSEIDIQLEDNANWQDNSKPINPYFTIKCNLPQIGNNDEY